MYEYPASDTNRPTEETTRVQISKHWILRNKKKIKNKKKKKKNNNNNKNFYPRCIFLISNIGNT